MEKLIITATICCRSKKVKQVIEDSCIPCTFSGGLWMPYITFDSDPNYLYRKLRE
ncbi:MAG: hypothetical protein ACTSV5_14410 [Promethearchaeota archaeon]